MKLNKIIIIITASLAGSAFAINTAEKSITISDFDNDNVTIHKLGIEAAIQKAKIQKENMDTALNNAIIENITSEKVTKNKSNGYLLESMYELKLKKLLHAIKTGKTNIEEIPEGFLKKKVKSLLLMDQNQMQKLLKKLELKGNEIKDLLEREKRREEEFAETTSTYEETIKKLREVNSKVNIKLKRMRSDLMSQIKTCKANKDKQEEGEKFDENRMEEEADKNLEINNVRVVDYITMGDYVSINVDFSFFISDITGEQEPVVNWINGVEVSPSRKVYIPGYGIIRIIAEGGSLNFYNGLKLLRSEEYK